MLYGATSKSRRILSTYISLLGRWRSDQLRILVALVLVTVVIHRMHRHDNCLEERGWQRELETGKDHQVAVSENVTSRVVVFVLVEPLAAVGVGDWFSFIHACSGGGCYCYFSSSWKGTGSHNWHRLSRRLVFRSIDTSSSIHGVHQCTIRSSSCSSSRNSSCSSSDSRFFALEISSRGNVPDVVDATTTSKSGYRRRQGLRLIMRVNGIDKTKLALIVSNKALVSSLASTDFPASMQLDVLVNARRCKACFDAEPRTGIETASVAVVACDETSPGPIDSSITKVSLFSFAVASSASSMLEIDADALSLLLSVFIFMHEYSTTCSLVTCNS
jgi:hypothetical protein